MKSNPRVILIGLVAVLAVGVIWATFAGSTSTPHREKSSTNKSNSVTLVIDFGKASNRQPVVRKLTNVPTSDSGWDLFKLAGLQVQGTDQYPTGFVCRIESWPTRAAQSCKETPTYSQGHWAYYVTNPAMGNGWLLSGQGAAMHHPECGSYEGWSWISPGENTSARQPSLKPSNDGCRR